MPLPKKKTPRTASLNGALILVYGKPGTGKTTMVCSSGDTLLLHTPSAGHLVGEAYKHPIAGLGDLRAAVTELISGGSSSYKAVAIDMLGDVVEMCAQEVIAEYNDAIKANAKLKPVSLIGDIPHGAGWAKQRDKVMNVLKALTQLSIPVYLTSHTRTEEIKAVIPYDQMVPEFSASLREKILGMCDMVGHISVDGQGKRSLIVSPSRDAYAKNRLSDDQVIEAAHAAIEGLVKAA